MTLALLIIAVVVIASLSVGGVMMIFGLRNAPEGYEDENGFHCGKPVEALIPVPSTEFAVCIEDEMAYAGR